MSFGGQKQTVDRLTTFNWLKKSVFFELEYYSSILLRHNLMSCTLKKMCDNLLNIMLRMDKSKNTDNARKDLDDMKIRPLFHLFTQGDKLMKPVADFMLTLRRTLPILQVHQIS